MSNTDENYPAISARLVALQAAYSITKDSFDTVHASTSLEMRQKAGPLYLRKEEFVAEILRITEQLGAEETLSKSVS